MHHRRTSATKVLVCLQNPWYSRFSRYFAGKFSRSSLGVVGFVASACGACVRANPRSFLKHFQANQQESCTEVSPIYASVDHGRRALYPLRSQGQRQLGIAPVACLHLTFYQQAGLISPLFHRLRFCLRSPGCWGEGHRSANSDHVSSAPISGGPQVELESILTCEHASWLYLPMNHMEVVKHA